MPTYALHCLPCFVFVLQEDSHPDVWLQLLEECAADPACQPTALHCLAQQLAKHRNVAAQQLSAQQHQNRALQQQLAAQQQLVSEQQHQISDLQQQLSAQQGVAAEQQQLVVQQQQVVAAQGAQIAGLQDQLQALQDQLQELLGRQQQGECMLYASSASGAGWEQPCTTRASLVGIQ